MADPNRSSLKEFIASISTIKGDLSNITAPPFLLASQSTAEFPSYWAERPHLFCAPTSSSDPAERMMLVLRWFLASLKRQQYAGRDERSGVKKPLNAFLGEVFIGAWGGGDDGRTGLISEQVSHHPPVTACYLWNDEKGIRAEGYACQNITFSGSVNIKQLGHAIIRLDKFNEDYLIPLPQVKVSGLLTGTPYPELTGNYDIVSSSGYTATIDFSGKKMLGLSGTKNGLHAAVYGPDDISRKNPVYTVNGTWNDTFTFTNASGKVIEEFNTNTSPPLPTQISDLSSLDPWESRKAWHGTINALDNGNMQAAVDEKSKIEQGQREMRRKEQQEGKVWKQVFFEKKDRDEVFEVLRARSKGDAVLEDGGPVWRFVGEERALGVSRPFHGDLVPWSV